MFCVAILSVTSSSTLVPMEATLGEEVKSFLAGERISH
jgi:hypothetical protein